MLTGAPAIFTGEGPNRCECGQELPGTSHWSDEAMPAVTCPACKLHHVLEDGGVAIYATDDWGPAQLAFCPVWEPDPSYGPAEAAYDLCADVA